MRLFHWSLVAAFTVAWLSAEDWPALHEISGYVVAALIAFRLVWGVVGPRYARFSQFVRGPGEALAYLRDMAQGRERRHIGHNPAGAAMILALLLTLAGTAFTGWLLEDESRNAMLPALPGVVAPAYVGRDGDKGEAHGALGEGGDNTVKDLHETLANLALLLVALHVGGVALASWRHRENLARAMVTGRKRAPGAEDVV